MDKYLPEDHSIKPLLEYYSKLKFQNTFLDYGIIVISNHNIKKLHDHVETLDNLKDNLIKNPENRILKLKFQLKLSQLKSIVLTQKRLEVLTHQIKNLKHGRKF